MAHILLWDCCGRYGCSFHLNPFPFPSEIASQFAIKTHEAQVRDMRSPCVVCCLNYCLLQCKPVTTFAMQACISGLLVCDPSPLEILRFCLYNFWNMQISRAVLVLYLLVMLTGLLLYTDFQNHSEGILADRLNWTTQF